MGRGNWFPGSDSSQCRLVYVDYGSEFECDDDALFAWQECQHQIQDALPPSFIWLEGRRLPTDLWLRDRDSVALAYNGLFTLWIDGQGDSWHMGLALRVNDDAPKFALSRLDDVANKLFSKLAKVYRLSVRTGPWTSCEYSPV